jgi:hypothetical protein
VQRRSPRPRVDLVGAPLDESIGARHWFGVVGGARAKAQHSSPPSPHPNPTQNTVQKVVPRRQGRQALRRGGAQQQGRVDLGGAVHRLRHLRQGEKRAYWRSAPDAPPSAVAVPLNTPLAPTPKTTKPQQQKCPFEAIMIINLPKNLESHTTHRYGPNSFKLHRMPMPRPGQVLGLVGTNGIGKVRALEGRRPCVWWPRSSVALSLGSLSPIPAHAPLTPPKKREKTQIPPPKKTDDDAETPTTTLPPTNKQKTVHRPQSPGRQTQAQPRPLREPPGLGGDRHLLPRLGAAKLLFALA